MSGADCGGRGCCFDGSVAPEPNASYCFFPVAGKPVTTLHVINSNHFDAGYADLTVGVINMYFDTYFPRAAKIGAELRAATGQPLKWMTFSYIVSLYVDCPPGMRLHCPDPGALTNFSAAVKARDIVWPAFPTNAELAIGDASILTFGVHMCNQTSDHFGVPRSQVLSDRDVPGLPRSSIPILKQAGIKALTEGMNGRMVPVNVPPIFMWEDPASQTRMLTLWHWAGYGQLGDPGNPVQVPGSSHAIVYTWRGDNAGPPTSLAEAVGDFAKAKAYFPAANVVTSTFDEFVDAVVADGAEDNLPVVTKDLADTWAWGMASDPIKLAKNRAMQRVRSACEAAGVPECTAANPQYYNFSRALQKNLEHTWGVSVFHYGPEANTDWDNVKFHQKLESGQHNLALMVSSWLEQRDWGIGFALDALRSTTGGADHPALPLVEAEFAAMEPTTVDPTGAGFKRVTATTAPIRPFGKFAELEIGADGSIVGLTTAAGSQLAGPDNKLGLARYQTLVEADFLTWQDEYIRHGAGGGNEFGKPSSFMQAKPTPEHNLEAGVVKAIWRKGDTLLVDIVFATELNTIYGAPATARMNYTATAAGITAELLLQDKTATRLPEAFYVSFNPVGSGEGSWAMDKLGSWVDPLDVADGASKGLHCVTTGVAFNNTGQSLTAGDSAVGTSAVGDSAAVSVFFRSDDAALARWDQPLPFPTPLHRQPDLSQGLHWLLFDNIWNTNYPFWLPFDPKDKDIKYRFAIEL